MDVREALAHFPFGFVNYRILRHLTASCQSAGVADVPFLSDAENICTLTSRLIVYSMSSLVPAAMNGLPLILQRDRELPNSAMDLLRI
jgi:hypothetical protein